MTEEVYHYEECGLDNVFLVNGFSREETTEGKAIAIDDLDGLHRAIGEWLVGVPRLLSGKEFRFLRHEMDLSQKRIAMFFGVEEQTISLWEREKHPLDKMADRLVRALYIEFIDGPNSLTELCEKLAELDQKDSENGCFIEDNGWHISKCAA